MSRLRALFRTAIGSVVSRRSPGRQPCSALSVKVGPVWRVKTCVLYLLHPLLVFVPKFYAKYLLFSDFTQFSSNHYNLKKTLSIKNSSNHCILIWKTSKRKSEISVDFVAKPPTIRHSHTPFSVYVLVCSVQQQPKGKEEQVSTTIKIEKNCLLLILVFKTTSLCASSF